jgi:hypothetical protein
MNVTVNQNYSWGKPAGAEYHTGPRRPNSTPLTFNLDNIFGAILQAEERANKTDQILPFPLDTTNENLANITIMVKQLKTDLIHARSTALLTKAKKESIREIIRKTKKIEEILNDIKDDFGKMKL